MTQKLDLSILEDHSKLLIESYKRLTGNLLLELSASTINIANDLYHAPFVLLSHGVEADPILNYGNRLALELWEMDWSTFTSTPSRLTAESTVREKREMLLKDVRSRGFSSGYSGIRVSSSGRRFEIRNVTVWTVIDSQGVDRGQAAVFSEWGPI